MMNGIDYTNVIFKYVDGWDNVNDLVMSGYNGGDSIVFKDILLSSIAIKYLSLKIKKSIWQAFWPQMASKRKELLLMKLYLLHMVLVQELEMF